MDLITYIYIAVIIIFLVGLIWIWTQVQSYFYPQDKSDPNDISNIYIKEIYPIIYQHHQYPTQLKQYIEETHHRLPYNYDTLNFIKEDCKASIIGWKQKMKTEHYQEFYPLQYKRWKYHIDLIDICTETTNSDDEDINEEIDKYIQSLRKVNRKLSELHEDWWGLSTNSDKWLRYFNSFDQALVGLCSNYVNEENIHKSYKHLEYINKGIEELITQVI